MRKILTGLCVLLLSSPAYANPITLSVGLPESMTLVVGQPTAIPAAIINTGTDALDFGCAQFVPGCGIQPAATWDISFLHRSYFSAESLDESQFAGLVLAPGARFDFTLLTFTLNSEPPFPILMRLGFAVLSPYAEHFQAPRVASPLIDPVITIGTQTAFSALAFHRASSSATVPDHGSAWTLFLAAGALAVLRHRSTPRRTDSRK